MKLSHEELKQERKCDHCRIRLAVKKIWLRDKWKYYCNTCWK